MVSFGLVWRPCRVTSSLKKPFRGSRNINSPSPSAAVVLNIPKANVYRFGDANNRATPVFRDLEWTVKTNESWGVVGSGSGEKSSLFDMLMGHLRIDPPPPPPMGLFPFLSAAGDPHNSVGMVSFANKRTVGGAFYDYTARYGAVREEDRITLRQSMFPEMIDDLKARSRISLDPPPTTEQKKLFEYLVARMGLGTLLDLPRIALSNGQTRRARILKALLGKPKLLLLDEPLTGLDVENRAAVLAILRELHAACDPHIIIGLRIQDAVPDWITHLALVGAGQVRTGCKDDMTQPLVHMREGPKGEGAEASTQNQRDSTKTRRVGAPVVQMKNVSVAYGPRQILKNITWTIRKGERYHLQGTNGSGKTTLLSLLTGDHPQSYTQRPSSPAPDHDRHLLLFGTPRSLLATPHIHSRIGLFTPELFDAFPRRSPGMSVWEVITTGFEGGFVPRGADSMGTNNGVELSTEEREWRVRRCWAVLGALGPGRWSSSTSYPFAPPRASTRIPPLPSDRNSDLHDPDLSAFARTRFPDLPVGAQRMVLLMRALVGRPPLVLLDEVWSGMDEGMVRAAHTYLRGEKDEGVRTRRQGAGGARTREWEGKHDERQGITAEQAVVVVTHLEEEVPWGARDGVRRVVLRDGELSLGEGGSEPGVGKV
ncbi:P-loop containing nucleoside triphosphate hydrolase protein [Mycena haematopus]|nr:P-loop containing nucleoside triphosphate hydrolase protein [Mycena haematopus]